mgnify:CR=1 FL=1
MSGTTVQPAPRAISPALLDRGEQVLILALWVWLVQRVLQFQFEQPLMQGFGVEINQLRASHPGSILNPGVFQNATSTEGILITRIRFDQHCLGCTAGSGSPERRCRAGSCSQRRRERSVVSTSPAIARS